MRTIIVFILIYSVSYAVDLNIRIIPDTIYVGSLSTITIFVKDLQKGEYPVFPDLEEQTDVFSVVEHTLGTQSADYIVQFWKTGMISIPSISILIKRYTEDIANLHSGNIEISVLSSIKENNASLREIKPMHELTIMSPYKVFLYILLILMGIYIAIYLVKKRHLNQYLHYDKEIYKKSIFQETIKSLQSLELPKNINIQTTEAYYMQLSHITRIFIKEEYFIRATEMTTEELEIYFKSINLNDKLINTWLKVNKIADMAKFAGNIPRIDQFNYDKENFIHIIKSLHKFESHISV